MKLLISLYYFSEKPLAKMLRLAVFLVFIAWVVYAMMYHDSLKLPLFFFMLITLIEIFFHFKLYHLYPTHTLADNPADLLTTATMPVLAIYELADKKKQVQFLLQQEEIHFFINRMMTEPSEIPYIPIAKEQLLAKANEYAKQTNTHYVDTPHLFAAYLSLIEPQSKLLFTKKLKEADLLRIIIWTILTYPKREEQTHHFQVIGEGYGEALTTGWTYETSKYTTDWTTQALQDKPHMFGVTDVFAQIVSVLSQQKNNNVLLVGDPGCGKHMLIDKLAFESYNGHVPPHLQHKRVLALLTGSLLAGLNAPTELETRLEAVLNELAHADVVIAIPEIQDILGSSTFNIDLSGILLPYLDHGTIPIIATTTHEHYKKYVEHSSLSDVFTVITIKQPDTETLFGMLFMAVLSLEEKQHVHFSYLSLVTAAQLATRFDTTGSLPGSAIKLLEATAAEMLLQGKMYITDDDVITHVEKTTHVPIAAPKAEEKKLLINFEQVLHEKVIGQDNAIQAVSQSMRRLREGLSESKKPISFLFLGPTGVGKTETAKALADTYYHGTSNMLRFDMSEYSGDDGLRRLLGAAPGQGDETGELSEKVFDHPSSLILLDEFEKAHPSIHDLFLQILDDGRLTDNKGKTVSFTNSIIIATSNAGSETIREHISKKNTIDKQFHDQLVNHLEEQHIFKPELLNRFDAVVLFEPLTHSQVLTITSMLLKALSEKLAQEDITINFDQTVIEKIASESFDMSMGARPIKRYIQDTIEDIIAKEKLNDTLSRGSNVTMQVEQAAIVLNHTN